MHDRKVYKRRREDTHDPARPSPLAVEHRPVGFEEHTGSEQQQGESMLEPQETRVESQTVTTPGHGFDRLSVMPAGVASPPAPPDDPSTVEPGISGGQLPQNLERKFESSLGVGLNGVRVHTGPDAESIAHDLGARGLAVGRDVYLSSRNQLLSTQQGERLLAHEVAHAVQQGPASSQPVLPAQVVSQPGDPLEREADRAAEAMIRSLPFRVTRGGGAAPPIQRQAVLAPPPMTPAAFPRDWGSEIGAQSGDIAESWSGGPAFTPEAAAAAKVNTAVGAGVSRFSSDWGSLQTTWNTVGPLITAYREAASNAAAEGITGPASAYNPEGVIRKPGDPKADLAGAVERGKVVGSKSDVKIGDVFDGSSLKPSVSKTKVDRGDALDEKVNALTGDAQRECEDALDGISKAHLEYKNKVIEVKNALKSVTIKKQEKESAGDEAAKVQIEREKAIMVGGIEATAGIFKMGESYLTARASGAGGPKKDPGDPRGKALGGSGIVDTAAGVITYFVGQSYDQDLHAINLKLESAKQFIATHNVEIEENNVEKAINDARIAEKEIQGAKRKLAGADQKRRDAIKELAKAAKAAAAAGGASKAEQERLEVAIRALPAIELVVSRLRNITSKMGLPQYSPESGLGAAFATNVPEFINHYGILVAAGAEFSDAQPKWEGRLTEINNFIRSLHSSAVP